MNKCYRYRAKRFDCGNEPGYLKAPVEFASQHPKVKIRFEGYLNNKLLQECYSFPIIFSGGRLNLLPT